MFVTNWISTTKIQKISEITNFFRHYFLSRTEVNLDFKGTDLLVLSACKTGQGKVTAEGVFGLQRAFKKAGVGTIIMSLWNVDDKVTSEFMIAFYEQLTDKANNWNKRKAFEQTKEIIRKEHPDPYYWAAFVMLD